MIQTDVPNLLDSTLREQRQSASNVICTVYTYIYLAVWLGKHVSFVLPTITCAFCHVTFVEPICSQFLDLQDITYTGPHDLLPPRAMLGASVRARSHGGVKITLPMSVPLPSREQPRRHERQPIRLHPLGARSQRNAQASKLACGIPEVR